MKGLLIVGGIIVALDFLLLFAISVCNVFIGAFSEVKTQTK